MPHIISFVKPQPIDELTGTFDALNETTNFDDRGFSPISGNGVFKPQDIDAKGSVIVGDNHFTPDRRGDSLTENGGFDQFRRSDLEGQAFLREQRFAVRGDGDNEGWACNCVPDSLFTETFDSAAGMNSFGESLNPVLENGANSGPGGTSYLTGSMDFPTDNIGGSASPGGDNV